MKEELIIYDFNGKPIFSSSPIDLERVKRSSIEYRTYINLFGYDSGRKIFRAMTKLSEKGLNVNIKNSREIFISKEGSSEMRIFKFPNKRYNSLKMPDGEIKTINQLSYKDIEKHLDF